MYRRDRIASGSSVSSVVSSFTRKSKESTKENVPSKLPRGPTNPKELVSRNKEPSHTFNSRSRDYTNQNGSSSARSEHSSVSSRRESATSSVSSTDGEPASPVTQTGSLFTTVNNENLDTGKITSPKV